MTLPTALYGRLEEPGERGITDVWNHTLYFFKITYLRERTSMGVGEGCRERGRSSAEQGAHADLDPRTPRA